MGKQAKALMVIPFLFLTHFAFFYFGYSIGPGSPAPVPDDPTHFAVDDFGGEFTALAVKREYGSIRVHEIRSIYDGDTFKVTIPGWPGIVGNDVSIRINGIDTPERRGTSENIKTLAAEARQTTVTLLREAETVELRNIQRGKYFRIIADVFVDDRSLAEILIEKKLAKPYDGGTRPQWTQEDYDGYFKTTDGGTSEPDR
jgi:endonuclease YncB( thermonuclease family)